tara:strand:- start:542 stop:760 length:219 start_codon:yes stop_codon:yes gene_type:complete
MAVSLVNLSNKEENKLRVGNKSNNNLCYYSDEYRGLNIIERAKKAALYASGNGRCWWIYDYVYRELTWRDSK